MIWAVLFLSSLASAEFTPLPADTPESTNSNFKIIDDEIRRLDTAIAGALTAQSSSSYTYIPAGTAGATGGDYTTCHSSVSLTMPEAGLAEISFSGAIACPAGASPIKVGFLLDGAYSAPYTAAYTPFAGQTTSANAPVNGSFAVKVMLAAGAHTACVTMAISGGGTSVYGNTASGFESVAQFGIRRLP